MSVVYDLTDWFPSDTRPYWIGVYEVRVGRFAAYRWFDGRTWMGSEETPELADQRRHARSLCQNIQWRGTARPYPRLTSTLKIPSYAWEVW